MITIGGIRNALWCALAFIIVVCATAPLPTDEAAVGRARAAESGAPAGSVRT
jgi:hypothetical protein